MIDSRFPWIVRIDSAPLGEVDRKRLRRLCDRVSRRTGRRIGFNRRTKALYVWQKEINQGLGWPFKVIRDDGTLSIPDEEEMVRIIYLGQVPPDVKAKWQRQQQWLDDQAENEEMERILDERRPDALDHLRRRRNRAGMSSKFRPSVVVDGFKK